MPRFVVLEHHHQGVHWDLMLESAGALRTWRLEGEPADAAIIRATPLADHRSIYLEYEGEISGGRGSVTRWDAGSFEWLASEADCVIVKLAGKRLVGDVYLCKVESGDWEFRLAASASPS